MQKAYYFVLEGCDGCGKSTQADLLVEHLNSIGKRTVLAREPGSPLVSFNVRNILTETTTDISQMARELLFAADRSENTYRIKKLLDSGVSVVSDRSYISGLSYAMSTGVDIVHKIIPLMKLSLHAYPDAIVMVDTPSAICSKRRDYRGDPESYEEAKGNTFMHSVSTNMKHILRVQPLRPGDTNIPYQIIDGELPISSIQELIKIFVTKHLKEV